MRKFKALFQLRDGELAPTLLMSAYFFLVITTFWMLKPIKKSTFLGFYRNRTCELSLAGMQVSIDGPQAELLAKVLNMVVAGFAAVLFVALTRRYRREWLSYLFGGSFVIGFSAFTRFIDVPSEVAVWAFYMFGDLFNMLMVAAFLPT